MADISRERPALETLQEIPGLTGKVEVKEAARVLGVSRTQIIHYVRRGYLDAIRANNSFLLERGQVEDLYRNPPPRGWEKGRKRKAKQDDELEAPE